MDVTPRDTGGRYNRRMDRTFVSAIDPPPDSDTSDRCVWFVFRGSEILVIEEVPVHDDGLPLFPDSTALAVKRASTWAWLPKLCCRYGLIEYVPTVARLPVSLTLLTLIGPCRDTSY